MTAAARARARLSPAERRARLLAAATRVLLRHGTAGTRVADVVRGARVSRGTFYRHFHSKRGLLGILARDLTDRLRPAFAVPEVVRTKDDLATAIEALHRATLEAIATERAGARLLFAAGTASEPGVVRAIATWEDQWRRLAAGLLKRAEDASLLRADADAALAAECWLASVLRVVRTRVVRNGASSDVSRLAASLARLAAASVMSD